jgi:hypothetical protein
MDDKQYNITIQLNGGLGNMLFQIATTFSTALKQNKKFYCDEMMGVCPHRSYTYYTENILRKITFDKKTNVQVVYPENNFSFSPIPNLESNVELKGYFQSEKYFYENRNDILELFQPSEKTKKKVDEFFNQHSLSETCSIHIRRGDYTHLSDFHPLLDINYYEKAINIVGQNINFLIFSDDLEWCKSNLSFIKNKTFVNEFEDFEQLYLMSLCTHNIIANSTFSWWGTWLNKNENKKVIAPSLWFGRKLSHYNTNDLYCKNWFVI